MRKKHMKPAYVFAVRWRDCLVESGWFDADQYKGNLGPALAVGLYICHDRETLTIAPMYGDNGQCSDPITIPRSQILSIQSCRLLINTKADERRKGRIDIPKRRKWHIS